MPRPSAVGPTSTSWRPRGESGNPPNPHITCTRRAAAARSATEDDPTPLTVATEVADDLGREAASTGFGDGSAQPLGVRRLLGGDQAPKLRAGAVPMIDLRGDPGVGSPHAAGPSGAGGSAGLRRRCSGSQPRPGGAPSLADGRGWVEAHLSTHWRLDPADRAVEGADLLVARRVDHPMEPPTRTRRPAPRWSVEVTPTPATSSASG
ncbi:MAG: hypothetical protein R2704_06050 [Microthrixaceae bacterium]